MKVPPEITYRGVDKTEAIASLIDEKLAKLEQVCNYISSCHIAVEKVHDHPRGGSPYRVRLDMTVPPSHELVAESNPSPGERNQYPDLDTVVRDAFSKAWRQLRDLARQQREHDTAGINDATQDTSALVTKLFKEQNYGFLKTLGGEDVYFNRDSVLHDDFDRLEVGTGVRFEAVESEEGLLHATTIQIVDKPGASVGKAEETPIEPPLGWE